jgi:hypothetical protein
MSSWYKKVAQVPDIPPVDATPGEARYMGEVLVDVRVPQGADPDQEYKMALDVLSKRLNRIEGDASVDTGFPASIRFTPQGLQKSNG